MSTPPSDALSRRLDPRAPRAPVGASGSAIERGQGANQEAAQPATENRETHAVSALDHAHSALGNQFLTDSPVFASSPSMELGEVDSATSIIQQHTMGSVALAMAGLDTADMVPGHAPLSVMRQLMRHSQAEAEGLDTAKAASRIGSRGGQPLPEAVRARMERAFGHDFSHVRIHTDGGAAQAADALHAVAFAVGRDIYFGRGAWRPGTPAGDELLAHELTHVVQADEGRLPTHSSSGGMDVSSPTDPHEREAVSMGRQVATQLSQGTLESDTSGSDSIASMDVGPSVALGESGAAPVTDAPASGPAASESMSAETGAVASRDTQTTTTPTSGTSPTSSTPSTESETTSDETNYATLYIAGKETKVAVPAAEGRAATAEVTLDERPVEGIHLTSATLHIDAEGVVVGGTIRGKLEVGGFFEGVEVSLGVLPGGQVAPGVQGIPIKVGNATGTMDLEITEAGLKGAGTIEAQNLGLPSWLGIEGGKVEIGLDQGSVSGDGFIKGNPTPHGVAEAKLKLTERTLETHVTFIVTPGLEPIPRVRIEHAELSGTMVTDLADTNLKESGGEPWTGTAGDTTTETTTEAPAATNTPGNRKVVGEGLSATDDAWDVASGYQKKRPSKFDNRGSSKKTGTETSTSTSTTPGGEISSGPVTPPPPRGEDAFLLKGKGRVVVADWVTGDLDLAYDPLAQNFDADGVLTTETERALGQVMSYRSEVSLSIRQNVPIEATARVDFTSEEYKLKGKITGDFDFEKERVDGDVDARITHHLPFEGSYGQIRILRHSRVTGRYRNNEFKDLKGKLAFDANLNAGEQAPLQIKGHVEGDYDQTATKLEGEVVAFTQEDFVLPTGGGAQASTEGGEGGSERFVVLKESRVKATLTDTQFVNVTMDAGLQYDRNGEPFLRGNAKEVNYDVNTGMMSGIGQLTLLKSLERKTKNGEWAIRILKGSNVDAKVEDNQLQELGGDITIQVDDSKGPLANGIIAGAVIQAGTWETSGVLKLTTARKFFHPGEGQTLKNGYGLEILPGSGINGTIEKDVLTKVGGDLRTMLTDEEGSLARLRLEAQLDLETNEIDGKGTISLAREFVVAEDLAGQGWEARVLRGTKAVGHIQNDEFTKVNGVIKSGIFDEEGKFMEVVGAGEWTVADDLFDIVGTITLKREKMLADGGEGGWSIALVPGKTTAQATIEDDVFQGITGTISTLVRRAGTDFAKLALEGSWNETEGFKGEGSAELLLDIDVANTGSYHLWVTKGTGAKIGLDNGGITEIGGKIPLRLDKNDAAFIKGHVEGNYKLEEKLLSGKGEAEVLIEEELGRLGDDQLWLIKGGGATVTLVDNELTRLGGMLNLSVRNTEGEYAKVALEGSFDAKTDKGFSGSGAVTVTRDNQLFSADAYSFWLKKGVGAKAHIKDNVLEKIDGQVPFMVRDGAPEALIEGSVNGVYDPQTGQVTGNGAVYLGRDLTYDLGSGVTLKLLKGSGGKADVKDSQLQRLGGMLTAELWRDGEGVVRMTAEGEYNVIHNTLTRLEGKATLLKPIELADGDIVIQNVEGHATLENNELVAAGGSGEIIVHPLNDMKGTFEVEWSNRGGNEVYQGRGWLDFTLIDRDPETGRGMSGLVFAEIHSQNGFKAAGEVDYDINEIIGGKIQVAVDQRMDPLLYGDIVVDTALVEARELFGLEKDIVPEQTIRLPYGLALFYGMKAGMGLQMQALHLNARIAVGNWRPLSQDAPVPSFETGIHLGWGMDFRAMVAPYMGIGGDIGVASAQMGVRGEVGLDVPFEVRAGGLLRGDKGGFYGELAVGAAIAADMNLAIIPYIKGEALDMFSFEEDLDRFEQPLGELFYFEWGGKYIFGDETRKENAPIQRIDIPTPKRKNTKIEGKPELGFGNGAGAANNKKGGPQIESGKEVASNQKIGDGDMSEVMQTLNDVIAVIEALGAAGQLAGMIAGPLAALATFGPAGLIVHTVWAIYTGELSWDAIKTAVSKLVKGIRAAGRLLAKHMPPWWNSIQDIFSGEAPSLLDALFGEDDRMREAVRRGDHKYANAEMRGQMINVMIDGWTGEADQECILVILKDADRRGDLRAVVRHVDGGRNTILWDLDGTEDRQARRLFRRHGIR